MSALMFCYATIASQFLTFAIASTIIFSSLLKAIALFCYYEVRAISL
ncbi:MAG TPA: hypothetical protein VE956_22620 [Nodularia sp. (in: cyanobacteria)]|nr:hypothetical protein [Nodularia sp. (in: cyanobacteria)]